ncbi:phosphopantothenate/pantothenate synthetase [Candidatus Heimdallarchaeota archaeon]|nr:MAG: phosphopantothenate/pantothenate synthetase [Candidatus Heimdallarchaeota archaeon]
MTEIPKDHPRYESLTERHNLIEGMHQKIVAEAGLIAHGRGEAFDYLLGEATPDYALIQEKTAVAMLLRAKKPVISVNGNIAVICPKELVQLSEITNASLEVNLFYRTKEREENIANKLRTAGANKILGVNLGDNAATIPEITHNRRIVDPKGIATADVVFVPLEDGDRTMALRKMGKKVITVDLNPLSRTSIWSSISIVNHVKRATKEMIGFAQRFSSYSQDKLDKMVKSYDNNDYLQISVRFMAERLLTLAKQNLQEGEKK